MAELKSGSAVGDVYNIASRIPKEGWLIGLAIAGYFTYKFFTNKKKWDILRDKARKVINFVFELKPIDITTSAYKDMEQTYDKFKPEAEKLLEITLPDIVGLGILNEIVVYKGERLSCYEALIEVYSAYLMYNGYKLGRKGFEIAKEVITNVIDIISSSDELGKECWNWYIDGFTKSYINNVSVNYVKNDLINWYKKGRLKVFLKRAKRRNMRHKYNDFYYDCKYRFYEDYWLFMPDLKLNKQQLDVLLSTTITLPRIRNLL